MKIDLFGNIIKEEEQINLKVEKPSPFGFISAIADKKYPDDMNGYNPYITNAAFSQRKDTVIYANEMNKYHALSDKAQFDFYFYTLPKRNLFAKWAKATKEENAEYIMEYYNVSRKVALDYLKVMTDDQVKEIFEWCKNSKGGR